MQITIDIPDGSPELDELQYVVSAINAETARNEAAAGRPAPRPITITEWISPIVMGHLKKRVQQRYLAYARNRSTAELKDAFGDLDTIRNRRP